jgi:hypothetical protein
MMGSGKSTVGRLMSEALGYKFLDRYTSLLHLLCSFLSFTPIHTPQDHHWSSFSFICSGCLNQVFGPTFNCNLHMHIVESPYTAICYPWYEIDGDSHRGFLETPKRLMISALQLITLAWNIMLVNRIKMIDSENSNNADSLCWLFGICFLLGLSCR